MGILCRQHRRHPALLSKNGHLPRFCILPRTGERRRLFTAVVHRLKATYNFTNRAFVRGIVQYQREDRNPDLYVQPGLPKQEAALSSSLLLAYKLNWQSVLFLGYGDNQVANDQYDLARHDRQIFMKLSYAFQR